MKDETPLILIVDDSENDRYILKRKIKKLGLKSHVLEADDGRSALSFFNEIEKKLLKDDSASPPLLPKIIFLDINMPFMGGFQFLEEFSNLKNNNQSNSKNYYDNVVFIMFTSSERKEDRQKAFSYDFVKDYVVKMPEGNNIKKLIEQYCFQ